MTSQIRTLLAERRNGLWIDAVCINQNDIEERNQQVKRMRDIYQQALGTISWLGPATDDGDLAMALLQSIAIYQINTRDDAIAQVAAVFRDADLFGTEAWIALGRFVCRPYWSRLWIIQEIVMGYNHLNIMLGDRHIRRSWLESVVAILCLDFNGLANALESKADAADLPENFTKVALTGLVRLQHLQLLRHAVVESENCMDLRSILTRIRMAEATDPKDRVYGILGLIDPCVTALITVDYTLSLEDIYTQFVIAVIQSTGKLDVILSHGNVNVSQRMLPSWVPDWTEGLAISWEMSPKTPYRADRNAMATVRFETKVMIARGFIIDRLDGLGIGPDPSKDFAIDGDIVQPVGEEDPYGDEAGKRNALWRTLVVDRDNEGARTPGAYDGILDVPWQDSDDEPGPAAYGFYQGVVDFI